MTPRAETQGSLMVQTWLHAGRLLTRWRRDNGVLLGSLLFPISLMLIYQVVLGEQVRKVTGVDSVYGLAPLCAVLSAIFGALGGAVSISLERDMGMISQMWVLPMHRSSPLTGRIAADAIRALLGTVLVTALAFVLGLRFTQGWLTALLFILIPSITVVGFTALVMALAIRSNGRTVMTWLVGVTVSLSFLNPGTTPIRLFPGWLQPLVRLQPMSPPIEAMWALAHGGPLTWPLAMTFLWAIGLLALFIPLAVRGYRVAAESCA